MAVERVLLASPRGFCAGVEVSIKALVWMLKAFGPPVYCYHEIVHNQRVVDRFEAMGVRFVYDIEEVPQGKPLMLSAHGSAPDVIVRARERTPLVVDAVCPLVTKVHHEVRARSDEGYHIVYVGHQGHDEAAGTSAIAPASTTVVATADELPDLAEQPVALLAQTTLTAALYESIEGAARTKYGSVWTPRRSDRCYATTNRQAAVLRIAPRADHMVIVGSATSANTEALASVAVEAGCPDVQRVDSRVDLRGPLNGTVGVSSGASAPDETVTELLERITGGQLDLVEEVIATPETEMFPVPVDLRELAHRLSATRVDLPDVAFVGDPQVSASARLSTI